MKDFGISLFQILVQQVVNVDEGDQYPSQILVIKIIKLQQRHP